MRVFREVDEATVPVEDVNQCEGYTASSTLVTSLLSERRPSMFRGGETLDPAEPPRPRTEHRLHH